MALAKKATETIVIKPIRRRRLEIDIVGDSPLITHVFDAKARRMILYKELGYTKNKKYEIKDPVGDFAASMYWLNKMPEIINEETIAEALEDAQFGFPACAFKEAACAAAYRNGWSKDKVSLYGAFHVLPTHPGYYGSDLEINEAKKYIEVIPNHFHSYEMIEIFGDKPEMREDHVIVGISSADIRYRGQFNNWRATLPITFNDNGLYTVDAIATFIEAGGFSCGIGEMRVEKGKGNGLYHISAIREIG